MTVDHPGSEGAGSPLPARRDTRLDPYIGTYAERTHGMTASAVRALFAVANRPEVVSLAGGMPNIADLPLESLGGAIARLVAEHGTRAMQYGAGQGEPVLRAQICEVMAEEAISAHPDDVVVSVGSQQGLALLTQVFCDPGDVILCEAPSYVGALGVFRTYQTQVVHVAMDADGLDPIALREAIASCRAAGKKIKFIYTIPNFHNPAGISQPLERRREILAIAKSEGILIVEDNPYGLLGFDSEPTPAIRSLDDGAVVYLGSFSKTFAPGFRIGWILAPHAIKEKLVLAQESATLCPPVFSQYTISAYLQNFDWRGQIKKSRELYRERRDAMLAGLQAHMPPGTSWTRPGGGFFVWLTIPAPLDAEAMLPRAVTARVAYVPGNAFYADGLGTRHMRLSYCLPTPDQIIEGTRRLAEVMGNELSINAIFSNPGRPRALHPYEAPGPDQR
ncbi:GntR family transcriptional regulator [Microlunatus endophyticus]|uniref:GntR family transcriptional regulator n=1 Tax=Microlunatus endophyticus TaxID=1716077 RepID=A0A917SCR1_9ACTN|nr:GntR family transcriptional regulator [Microlunatus endophyticus]